MLGHTYCCPFPRGRAFTLSRSLSQLEGVSISLKMHFGCPSPSFCVVEMTGRTSLSWVLGAAVIHFPNSREIQSHRLWFCVLLASEALFHGRDRLEWKSRGWCIPSLDKPRIFPDLPYRCLVGTKPTRQCKLPAPVSLHLTFGSSTEVCF